MSVVNYYASPTQSFGYYRGTPFVGGGAYQGGGTGPQDQGMGEFAQGEGPVTIDDSSWTPTIWYMAILIVIELIIVGCFATRVF